MEENTQNKYTEAFKARFHFLYKDHPDYEKISPMIDGDAYSVGHWIMDHAYEQIAPLTVFLATSLFDLKQYALKLLQRKSLWTEWTEETKHWKQTKED